VAEDTAGGGVALVFGTEESGLAREEADETMMLAHIATSSEHTSLNLGMAVGVVLYSLFGGESPGEFRNLGAPLKGGDRAYLKAHVRETLGGVARSDVARADIEASVERVFSHAELETRDARAWHTIMRALGNRKSPMDYGLGGSPRDARRDEALAKARRRPHADRTGPDADGTPGGGA
jgi:tRNA C32,U32 (ribose-2'-O)-methylase TrmJ